MSLENRRITALSYAWSRQLNRGAQELDASWIRTRSMNTPIITDQLLGASQENEYTGQNCLRDEPEEEPRIITTDEVTSQLKRLPLGEAAGIDGVMAEFMVYPRK